MYVCFHTQFSFVLYQMYLRLNVQNLKVSMENKFNNERDGVFNCSAKSEKKKNKQEGNVFDLI